MTAIAAVITATSAHSSTAARYDGPWYVPLVAFAFFLVVMWFVIEAFDRWDRRG